MRSLIWDRNQIVRDEVHAYKDKIESMVSDAITGQVRAQMLHYENLAVTFERFFNYEELTHILDRKADNSTVKNLESKMAR